MSQAGGTEKKWMVFPKKNTPEVSQETVRSQVSPLGKVWNVVKIIGLSLYRLRAVFMAVPVIIVALRLAAYNSEHLPLMVGIDLQTTGEFAHMISRETAVTVPLVITGGCLVITALARKNLYPWLISVFSLVLPLLLLFTNNYPA